MEEQYKFSKKGGAAGSDPGNFMGNSEADTEGIVDFMHEEIKKRPVDRKRLFRRARDTVLVAVLFGIVACAVFALLLPVLNNAISPDAGQEQAFTLPEDKPSEELSPEEMVESERQREATEEKEWIRQELEGILDETIVGVEQHRRISASLQELARDCAAMTAQVTGITEDTDWFDDAYENRNTAAGLVTKKADTGIFVMVQGRRIEGAEKILVSFNGGAEAEAQVAGSDAVTGLCVLRVPIQSIPAGQRDLIREAKLGTSAPAAAIGAPVVAIGSPTGSAGSVAYGYVTGAGEPLALLDNDLRRITTDIYGAGEATGILVDLDGAVTGFIDMRYKDGDIPNMLCAIGISELRPVIRRLEEGDGKAFLGICGADVTAEIGAANHIPEGVWVTRVEEDSPAMDAGIQKGDVITGFGDGVVLNMTGLIARLRQTEPGQVADLRIMRRKGGDFEEIRVAVDTK